MRMFLAACLVGCSFTSVKMDEPSCAETKLFEKAPFPVGVALDTEKFKYEEKYWKTAKAQFNSFTPEKILKIRFIQPKKGVFNFTETDHLIEYCRENKIRLHGHTLLWHKDLPEWLDRFKGSPEELDALMKTHIQTVIHHCKSFIKSWDVVNEAFNDDGTFRKNIWYKLIGETYIEKAFKYAREADPDAILFYNDYSLEQNGEKLSAVLDYLKIMESRGVKADGIGMQMHVSLEYPAITDINGASERIQASGLLVHYSELDVTLKGDHAPFASRKKLLELQKERVREIVRGYMSLNRDKQFGITIWGVSDNDSWLTEVSMRARPLLFDTRYRPKPAYCGFVEALRRE